MNPNNAVAEKRFTQLLSWLQHGEGLVPHCICGKCRGPEPPQPLTNQKGIS